MIEKSRRPLNSATAGTEISSLRFISAGKQVIPCAEKRSRRPLACVTVDRDRRDSIGFERLRKLSLQRSRAKRRFALDNAVEDDPFVPRGGQIPTSSSRCCRQTDRRSRNIGATLLNGARTVMPLENERLYGFPAHEHFEIAAEFRAIFGRGRLGIFLGRTIDDALRKARVHHPARRFCDQD